MNKPTTLREEFEKEWKDSFAGGDMHNWERGQEVADWWLDKFTSHSTELLKKIEEEIVEIRKIWESYDEYEKIINIAKIETLEKVINLIKEKNKSGTDGSISGYGGRGGDGSKV